MFCCFEIVCYDGVCVMWFVGVDMFDCIVNGFDNLDGDNGIKIFGCLICFGCWCDVFVNWYGVWVVF